jgi:hypothetical protein
LPKVEDVFHRHGLRGRNAKADVEIIEQEEPFGPQKNDLSILNI